MVLKGQFNKKRINYPHIIGNDIVTELYIPLFVGDLCCLEAKVGKWL
jgi:hypothetical protein